MNNNNATSSSVSCSPPVEDINNNNITNTIMIEPPPNKHKDIIFGAATEAAQYRKNSLYRSMIQSLWKEYSDIPPENRLPNQKGKGGKQKAKVSKGGAEEEKEKAEEEEAAAEVKEEKLTKKSLFVRTQIISKIRNNGGRFLLYDKNQSWVELNPTKINDLLSIEQRIQQALRDEKKNHAIRISTSTDSKKGQDDESCSLPAQVPLTLKGKHKALMKMKMKMKKKPTAHKKTNKKKKKKQTMMDEDYHIEPVRKNRPTTARQLALVAKKQKALLGAAHVKATDADSAVQEKKQQKKNLTKLEGKESADKNKTIIVNKATVMNKAFSSPFQETNRGTSVISSLLKTFHKAVENELATTPMIDSILEINRYNNKKMMSINEEKKQDKDILQAEAVSLDGQNFSTSASSAAVATTVVSNQTIENNMDDTYKSKNDLLGGGMMMDDTIMEEEEEEGKGKVDDDLMEFLLDPEPLTTTSSARNDKDVNDKDDDLAIMAEKETMSMIQLNIFDQVVGSGDACSPAATITTAGGCDDSAMAGALGGGCGSSTASSCGISDDDSIGTINLDHAYDYHFKYDEMFDTVQNNWTNINHLSMMHKQQQQRYEEGLWS